MVNKQVINLPKVTVVETVAELTNMPSSPKLTGEDLESFTKAEIMDICVAVHGNTLLTTGKLASVVIVKDVNEVIAVPRIAIVSDASELKFISVLSKEDQSEIMHKMFKTLKVDDIIALGKCMGVKVREYSVRSKKSVGVAPKKIKEAIFEKLGVAVDASEKHATPSASQVMFAPSGSSSMHNVPAAAASSSPPVSSKVLFPSDNEDVDDSIEEAKKLIQRANLPYPLAAFQNLAAQHNVVLCRAVKLVINKLEQETLKNKEVIKKLEGNDEVASSTAVPSTSSSVQQLSRFFEAVATPVPKDDQLGTTKQAPIRGHMTAMAHDVPKQEDEQQEDDRNFAKTLSLEQKKQLVSYWVHYCVDGGSWLDKDDNDYKLPDNFNSLDVQQQFEILYTVNEFQEHDRSFKEWYTEDFHPAAEEDEEEQLETVGLSFIYTHPDGSEVEVPVQAPCDLMLRTVFNKLSWDTFGFPANMEPSGFMNKFGDDILGCLLVRDIHAPFGRIYIQLGEKVEEGAIKVSEEGNCELIKEYEETSMPPKFLDALVRLNKSRKDEIKQVHEVEHRHGRISDNMAKYLYLHHSLINGVNLKTLNYMNDLISQSSEEDHVKSVRGAKVEAFKKIFNPLMKRLGEDVGATGDIVTERLNERQVARDMNMNPFAALQDSDEEDDIAAYIADLKLTAPHMVKDLVHNTGASGSGDGGNGSGDKGDKGNNDGGDKGDNAVPEFPDSSDDEGMQIVIKLPDAQTITLEVTDSYTIIMVKAVIKSKKNMKIKHQRLIFGNDELDDMKTLRFYKVVDSSELLLLAGGDGGAGVKRGKITITDFSIDANDHPQIKQVLQYKAPDYYEFLQNLSTQQRKTWANYCFKQKNFDRLVEFTIQELKFRKDFEANSNKNKYC